MSEIIFINLFDDEGKFYQSYRDEFWALVELSKFKTCKMGEIDYDSDNIYVNFLRNGDNHANYHNKPHKCKLVLWLLEWSYWENGIMKQGYLEDGRGDGFSLEPYWDQVWVSDRYYKNLLKEVNPDKDVRYCFFGGHPGFGGDPGNERWDFVTLSYDWGTRLHKIQILAQHGYSFAPQNIDEEGNPQGCWGEIKKSALSHARWGLCLHQYPTPFLNSQRLTLFASWKLPIISDYCVDPYPYKLYPEGLVHFNPRNTICGDRYTMKNAADLNYHIVTTNTFRQCVEDCVEGIERKII